MGLATMGECDQERFPHPGGKNSVRPESPRWENRVGEGGAIAREIATVGRLAAANRFVSHFNSGRYGRSVPFSVDSQVGSEKNVRARNQGHSRNSGDP